MSSTNNKKKIAGIGTISAIIVMLSSIFIYANVIKPQKYSEYMDLGNKYLLEENYEEAILAFEKAIKIDAKSIEARVGAAKGCLGINDIDRAVEKLQEAQNIDIENEKLLIEILDILKDVDSETAYDMLQIYINKVGEQNISDTIKNIFDESNEIPTELIANPVAGTYINPIKVKFDLSNIKFGHTYYYTTDGSIPNKSSKKYTENIEINKSTQINIIGYNPKGECTEVYEIKYIIDDTAKIELEDLIKKANSLLNNTKEGTEVGNCKPGSKEPLKNTIEKIEKKLKKQLLSYNDINEMKNKLKLSIKTFEDNIVKNIDIEKRIIGKNWLRRGDIFLVTKNRIEVTMNFHEGVYFDIIGKSVHENRIDYKVNYYGTISTISISINENNIINVDCGVNEFINGNYTIGNKNQIIEIAHKEQYIAGEPPFNDRICIEYYDYYGFEKMGISLNDVKNYYKNK